MSTLANIRTKVRRLTGRLSPQQITDSQIDDYVNTFYLYDFPEILRLDTLQTTFEFMTIPNVSEYDLLEMDIEWNGGTEKAANVYTVFQPPVYIAGYQAFWAQNREQFFRVYPPLADQQSSLEGDGSVGPYAVTLPAIPVAQGTLTIGTIDNTGANIQIVDDPQNRTMGNLKIINTTTAVAGSINYITGALTVTFGNNIPSGNTIFITWVPYTASRPQSMLLYGTTITLLPVPDEPYLVQMNAMITPTALLQSTDSPELKQWWQYLALGAAKKIFEDTQDPESLSTLLPIYKEQERLVLYRSIVQQTPQRTATIYTDMAAYPWGNYANRF